jgi:hypothetical protein
MTRRRIRPTALVGLALVALVVSLLVVPHVLAGATGIHQRLLLAPEITVCDRHYDGGDTFRTRAQIESGGGPMLLVDPGVLGMFAPCPPPDPEGNRPCTRDGAATPCATVVYVRVGEDLYAAYSLSGGP